MIVVARSVDLGGVVRARLMAMKPAWEEQLGRGIDLGEVSVPVAASPPWPEQTSELPT